MDFVLDIRARNGVPFRVVFGRRRYLGDQLSERTLVSFYDRRYPMSPHKEYGQFVSDYLPETMLEHGNHGLNLHDGVEDWHIDPDSMVLILDWLSLLLSR
jgi:hypothetical protein